MKRIFSVFALALGVCGAAFGQTQPAAPVDKANAPVFQDIAQPTTPSQIKFDATEVDYGTIQQGSEPLRKFYFTNVSDAPLTISNARGSCGCTVPEWPREAVQPGEKGEIAVRYDTNRVGPFTKTVTITTSGGENVMLKISGKVEAKPAEPEGLPANNNGMFKNN